MRVFVQQGVINLMGADFFPEKLIPIASYLCTYRNMNLIVLIKDENTCVKLATHIATYYTFKLNELMESLEECNRLTIFIQFF